MKINNKEFDKGLDDYIKRFDKAMIKKAKLGVLDYIKRWLKGRDINVQDKDKIREYINKLKKDIENN